MSREPIWMRPESAGVGRPAEHSRGEITAAAIAVADAEGFAAVTMRRVAGRIGTGAASLYRYVDNRGDLIDLMIDAGYGEIALHRTGHGWRADLVEVARGAIGVGGRHPWLPEALAQQPVPGGPRVARLVEHCLDVLAEHPAPAPRKLEAIAVLGTLMWQFAGLPARRAAPELVDAQLLSLRHLAADGAHPHLATALAAGPVSTRPASPTVGPTAAPGELLTRVLPPVLDGLLGPDR